MYTCTITGPDGGPAALKESSHMYFPSLSMPPSKYCDVTYSIVKLCNITHRNVQ